MVSDRSDNARSVAAKTRRPRLLFVVSEDWYFVSHRLALGAAACEAGLEVIVATRVSRHRERIEQCGIRVVPFDLDRGGINPFRDAQTLLRLIRLYREEAPDIVHHVALKPVVYGTLAARRAGVPAVVNAIAGLGSVFTSESAVGGLFATLVRRALRSALRTTTVIVQNPDDAQALGIADIDALEFVRGSGVDCRLYAPCAPASSPPVVMLPARMIADKGVQEFVDAAGVLRQQGRDARFVLVGAPDPCNRRSIPLSTLERWQQSACVEWWGHREDMPATLAQATIVCLPSYREGLPKALIEAAAAGRPIVTTDVPGCREVVRDGFNGLLVPARNATALAAALGRLLDEPNTCRLMGARSRRIAREEFDLSLVIASTLAIYRKLV
jgi:glycosyltransferase involved in cell wall biosynthesis